MSGPEFNITVKRSERVGRDLDMWKLPLTVSLIWLTADEVNYLPTVAKTCFKLTRAAHWIYVLNKSDVHKGTCAV